MRLDLTPLGERVRRARIERDLTVKALAERSGLSLRFLSDLERGKGNISIARLVEVARALSLPVSELAQALDAPRDRLVGHKPASTVALVGLRGAGKSTVGRRAAEGAGVRFIELDVEVEAGAGMPLQQIFEIYGDGYFRRLEREVLVRLLAEVKGGAVIATGGGIVMDPESWRILKRSTRTVWLKAKPEEHYRRVVDQGDTRPMKNRPSAMAELRALLAARAPIYAEAEETIDTSALGLEASIERLVGLLAA